MKILKNNRRILTISYLLSFQGGGLVINKESNFSMVLEYVRYRYSLFFGELNIKLACYFYELEYKKIVGRSSQN